MPPHSESGQNGCPSCSRSFPTSLGLELHGVRVHHKRGLAGGPDSGQDPPEPGLETSREEDRVQCELCSGSFADSDDLSRHVEWHHVPTPEPELPSEDELVREVADGLPNPGPILMFGSDRLGRTRGLLASARRKARRDSQADADQVIRKFWDGSDRKVLAALRSKGVDILGRNSVESGADGS